MTYILRMIPSFILILGGLCDISSAQWGPIDPDFLNWFWEVALDFNQVLKQLDYSQLSVKDASMSLNATGLSTPPALHGTIDFFDGYVSGMGLVGVNNRTVTCWTENDTVSFSGELTIENTYMQFQYDANTLEQGRLTGSAFPMMPQISMKCYGNYSHTNKDLTYILQSSGMKAPYNMRYYPENNNTEELSRITKYQFTSMVWPDFVSWINETLNDEFHSSIFKIPFRQCNISASYF